MKRKIIAGIILLLVLIGIIGYNYLYQDHREIASEKPVAELTPMSIVEIFKQDAANDLLNATVSVRGRISEIDGNVLTLDDKVSCTLTEADTNYKIGDSILLKGRCIGYDDLFEIVKLDQCSILK
jgi:hypothetical protein